MSTSLDRRQFLAQSGHLAAGLGALSLPSVTKADPNGTVSCAMIGVGGRGSGLARWAASHPNTRILSVCDVNRQNLERAVKNLAELQGGEKPRSTSDFRRVLVDRSIDAVIVATPHHWHGPIAVRALESGKHVYVEKPASHVFREGRRLVDAARRNRCLLQHGTQMRSSEVTAAAAEVLASGILGEIKMSKAWGVEPRGHHPEPVPDAEAPEWLDYDRWLGPAPERRFNPQRVRRWNAYRDYGNGEIGGDGIHDIDMARWGLGVKTHPVRITAHGSRIHLKGESDFPDNMIVTYQYAGDRVLIYENRNFAPYKMHGWDNGNIFYGTEGYMVFSRRGHFQTFLGAGEKEGPGASGGAGNEENVHHFLDCVRNDKPTRADAETAHLSCGLVHLGEIAYRTGRVLHFDPERERFKGDDAANALLTKEYREPWSYEETS